MCDVYKSTFSGLYPEIRSAISKAEFIAIDTEFTGLVVSESSKPSLFDSGEERYRKLKRNASHIVICQFGISAFIKDSKNNRYEVHTYNMYLCPMACGPIDVRFQMQASSLSFLRKYNFDFNKFIYDGISYLSEEQETVLREHLMSNEWCRGQERSVDEYFINDICNQVSDWLTQSKVGDSLALRNISDLDKYDDYVLHSEIKSRFNNIWSANDAMGNLVVENVTANTKIRLMEESLQDNNMLKECILTDMLGFTRVFRLLCEMQKPLVGHNMLMDLLLMYDKFHKPLPARYEEFKKEVHRLFPVIVDTKHVSLRLRRPLEDTGLNISTTLYDLYCQLESKKGLQYKLNSTSIVHATGFDRYASVDVPHEAGFDAFQCGCVFLRLCHIVTFLDKKSSLIVPCSFKRLLISIRDYVNKINIIRGTVNHICIDQSDPPSSRPPLLFVQTRKYNQKLSSQLLANWFAPHGSVDVRLQGTCKALVATSNRVGAKAILKAFRQHDKILVKYYSIWKHSVAVKSLLWTGTLVSAGICIWVLFSSIKQS